MNFLELALKVSKNVRKAIAESDASSTGINPIGQEQIQADVNADRVAIDTIRKSKFNCDLLTEETGLLKLNKKPDHIVTLDPLDGSTNFKRGLPSYSLGMACAPAGGNFTDIEEGFVINLVTDDWFYAKKGEGILRNGKKANASQTKSLSQTIIAIDFNNEFKKSFNKNILLSNFKDYRRSGSALIEMAYLSAGCIDAYIDLRDDFIGSIHAGGLFLLNESCEKLTDGKGKPLDFPLTTFSKISFVAASTRELHGEIMGIINTDGP